MWDIKTGSPRLLKFYLFKYYLNHVGYKEQNDVNIHEKEMMYYLNHVGYKGWMVISIRRTIIFVLSEPCGI